MGSYGRKNFIEGKVNKEPGSHNHDSRVWEKTGEIGRKPEGGGQG